jgi:hypothetical protein
MPGSGRFPLTRPARARREAAASPDLAPGLEGALVDALAGASDTPGVSPMLERVARAWLRSQGIVAARVEVSRREGAWTVEVLLPPCPNRVRTIRVSVA